MTSKGVAVISRLCPAHAPSRALEHVANRPIACHAIEALAAAGIEELAGVGPAAALRDVRPAVDADLPSGLQVTYLGQRDRADLLEALCAVAEFVGDDRAVVHLADGLLGQPLDHIIGAPDADLPDLLLVLHRSDDAGDALDAGAQRLLGVADLGGPRSHLALAGVCVFGPGALAHVARMAPALEPTAGLIEIAHHLASEGGTVEASVIRSWRRYAGNPHDLLELNRLILDRQDPVGGIVDRGDNRIEGRVIIHPSAEVKCSTILGPCIIGPDARVLSSYIGPYTSIGARAEIEGAEIVRSIVSEGVHIKHISGRIEESTIGRRASIFRDFELPRAMRLHVGEGVEVALQ